MRSLTRPKPWGWFLQGKNRIAGRDDPRPDDSRSSPRGAALGQSDQPSVLTQLWMTCQFFGVKPISFGWLLSVSILLDSFGWTLWQDLFIYSVYCVCTWCFLRDHDNPITKIQIDRSVRRLWNASVWINHKEHLRLQHPSFSLVNNHEMFTFNPPTFQRKASALARHLPSSSALRRLSERTQVRR